MAQGESIDVAGQMERIVALISNHPAASFFAVLALLLVMGFRKEGPITKLLGLLEARAQIEIAKEDRRIAMLDMVENRPQAPLPGLEKED